MPQDKHDSGYGKRATKGAVWAVLSIGVGKSASLVSQFILGWILSRGDFGVYAIAIAFSAVAMQLKNGGAEHILVQRGSSFNEWVPSVLWLALGFNLLSAVGLIFLAPLLARLYEAPEIKYLCWIIALSFPFATHVVVYRARLSVDMKFPALARVSAISSLVRHGSVVLFALAGFGVYSFVLPLLLVAIYEWYAYRKNAGIIARWQWSGLRRCGSVFKDSKWVLLGAGGAALALQGDYLIIGLLESKDLLGSYFFGFQLVASVAFLFAQGVQMVMLPSLVRFTGDAQRLRLAYIKTLRVLAIVLMPIGIVISMLAEPLLILLWGSKWEAAVIVVQLLALGFPSWALAQLSQAVYAAKGLWPLRSGMLYLEAMGIMLAAYIGAQSGGLLAIALSILICRIVMVLINLLVVRRILLIDASAVFSAFLWPILLALLCGGVSYSVLSGAAWITSPYWFVLIVILVFIVIYLALVAALMKERLNEVFKLIRSIVG